MRTSEQTARGQEPGLCCSRWRLPGKKGAEVLVRQGWKQPPPGPPGTWPAQQSPEDGPPGVTGALKRTRAEKGCDGKWGGGSCRPRGAAHSPAEEGLLQAAAGAEGLASEQVAHHHMQAACHEGQHGLRLQGPAARHQAEALQRGALAQRLEELGVGAEVGLLQPAGREDTQRETAGDGCACPLRGPGPATPQARPHHSPPGAPQEDSDPQGLPR